jgi:TfoX/Sxy family transcriptional regulator of competence genes
MKMPRPSPEAVARFDAAVPDAPGVERKPMFGQAAAFVNGNMFMGLYGEDLILRLAEPDREAMAALGGGPFAPMGRPMKEYATVARSVTDDSAALAEWVDRSLALAAAMPAKQPKPKRAGRG